MKLSAKQVSAFGILDSGSTDPSVNFSDSVIDLSSVNYKENDAVVDSGAEIVATRDKSLLHNLRPFSHDVVGFNGMMSQATLMGDMYLLLESGVELFFKDVLLIEGLKPRIYISCHELDTDIVLKRNGPVFINVGQKLMRIGTKKGKIWVLDNVIRSSPPATASNDIVNTSTRLELKRKSATKREHVKKKVSDWPVYTIAYEKQLKPEQTQDETFHAYRKGRSTNRGIPLPESCPKTFYCHLKAGHPAEWHLKPLNCQLYNTFRLTRLFPKLKTTNTTCSRNSEFTKSHRIKCQYYEQPCKFWSTTNTTMLR